MEKLAKHHPQHVAVSQLTPFLSSRRRIFESGSSLKTGTWLVLPYHPRFARMSAVLFRQAILWQGCQFAEYAPKVSWKLEHKSLATVIASDGKRKSALYRSGLGGQRFVFFFCFNELKHDAGTFVQSNTFTDLCVPSPFMV